MMLKVNGMEVAKAEVLCVSALQAGYMRVKTQKTPHVTTHSLQVNIFTVWVTLCFLEEYQMAPEPEPIAG